MNISEKIAQISQRAITGQSIATEQKSYKVYKSGDNIEIYEYDTQPVDNREKVELFNEKRKYYQELTLKKNQYDHLIGKCDYYEQEKGILFTAIKNKFVYERSLILPEYKKLKEYFTEIDERKKVKKTTEENKKRRMQTLRDNANNLKRMIREHMRQNVLFITLTYSERWALNKDEVTKSDGRFKRFRDKLQASGYDFTFIAVRELQKSRGDIIHYHMLISCEKLHNEYQLSGAAITNKRKNDVQKEFETNFMNKFWKFGFVDIRPVAHVDDFGAYMGKYMTKDKLHDMDWLKGKRLVLRSENIKKIEPISDIEEINSLISGLDLYKSIAQKEILENKKRKTVFTNGYSSEYTGNVNYYEINLNRLLENLEN